MAADSDPAERLGLRRLLRDEARMTWARKNLKSVFIASAGALAAGWALVEWLRDHVQFK